MLKDKVILGIDPGTNLMGYGIIHIQGNQIQLVDFGELQLGKIDNHGLKLKQIYDCVEELIIKHQPDEVAAESPFFGKNVQSMLKLGRAQGVALVAALNKNLPVFEYAPRTIKQSITGNGAASKEMVAGMIAGLLKIPEKEMPQKMDATDALAAALCHHFQGKTEGMKVKRSKAGSWAEFARNNPERLKKKI
ncbi:MAG: crossover junction endodeoxyribonuclease RuvC [Bacteroidia bacterium]